MSTSFWKNVKFNLTGKPDKWYTKNENPIRQCPGCKFYIRDEPSQCPRCTSLKYLLQDPLTAHNICDDDSKMQSQVMELWQSTVKECSEKDYKYVDEAFVPSLSSIYYVTEHYPDASQTIKWHRPAADHHWDDGRQWEIFGPPRSHQIVRGKLSKKSWFLDALTVVAERPDLLNELILTDKHCPEGCYVVRLCKDGRFVTVIVDDMFPFVLPDNLLYATDLDQHLLWVSLVEKAAAKLCGCYQALCEGGGGNVLDGLSMLTGCPCEAVSLKTSDTTKEKINKFYATLWTQMHEFAAQKFLMVATSNSEVEKEKYRQCGLCASTNYSVLNVDSASSENIVVLRRRLGETELAAKIENGEVRLSFKDFIICFEVLNICYVYTDWTCIRLEGSMPKNTADVEDLPIRRLNLTTKTQLHFTLYQKNQKLKSQSALMMDLCIVVFREGIGHDVESRVSFWDVITYSPRTTNSLVSLKCELVPGAYLVACISINPFLLDFDSREFALAVHSSAPLLPLRKLEFKETAMCDALIRLALLKGSTPAALDCSVPSGVLALALEGTFNGLLLMVENGIHNLKMISVDVDCGKSENVISTREPPMYSKDYISPGYRKIVAILSSDNCGQECSPKVIIKRTITGKEVEGKNPWEDATYPHFRDRAKGLHSPRPVWLT